MSDGWDYYIKLADIASEIAQIRINKIITGDDNLFAKRTKAIVKASWEAVEGAFPRDPRHQAEGGREGSQNFTAS